VLVPRGVCLLLQYPGVYVFITVHKVTVVVAAVPIPKLFAWGEGDRGGHSMNCERQGVKACVN
jgi:hypothetical protein